MKRRSLFAALAAVAGAAVFGAGGTASPAFGAALAAQVAPPAAAPTSTSTTTTTIPVVSAGPPVAPPVADDTPGSGLMNNLMPPDGTNSKIPDDHYDIGYSTGGGLFAQADVGRQATGTLTNYTFVADRFVVHAGLWLINWSLQFRFADILSPAAARIAATYQSQIVGPLRLSWFCLFLCVTWAGYQMLRGRMGRGLGELGVSLILLAVTGGVLATPSVFLLGPDGVMARAKDTAVSIGAVTASTTANPPAAGASPAQINAPLMEGLHHAFIEIPHQLLNWGQQLDVPGQPSKCLTAYQSDVAGGPWGASDKPRDAMTAAGCGDLAKFNASPTGDRFIGAVFCFFGSLIVIALAAVIAFGLAIAQFALAGLVICFPFVAALGLVPGAGRQVLWRWVTSILVAFATVVATVVVLSLLLVSVNAVVAALAGDALFVTFAALDILVVGALIFRHKIAATAKRAARNVGRRLEGNNLAGASGRGWMAAAPAAFSAAQLYTHARRVKMAANGNAASSATLAGSAGPLIAVAALAGMARRRRAQQLRQRLNP